MKPEPLPIVMPPVAMIAVLYNMLSVEEIVSAQLATMTVGAVSLFAS